MKQVYMGDISKHGHAFCILHFAFALLSHKLAIENGEPLFQVDYEDPGFDNLYFNDNKYSW